jgi:hypothetical protein
VGGCVCNLTMKIKLGMRCKISGFHGGDWDVMLCRSSKIRRFSKELSSATSQKTAFLIGMHYL